MTVFDHRDAPVLTNDRWLEDGSWDESRSVTSLCTADGRVPDRVIVVAAHPDDETLGAAGLMTHAARAGIPLELVLVTPGQGQEGDEVLGARRLREFRRAVDVVARDTRVHELGHLDGRVVEVEGPLTTALVELIGDGQDTLVVSPYARDGHTDHEAAGRAAATASARTGATCWQYPIWLWHWGGLEDVPWKSAVLLSLDPKGQRLKRRALEAYVSQTMGEEPMLGPRFLANFTRPHEMFVVDVAGARTFEALHASDEDPWDSERSWYERRKARILEALLPQTHYERGIEVGSSVGSLARLLSTRCDRLVALDSSPTAIHRAMLRAANEGSHGIDWRVASVPEEWPEGSADLVVLSEILYFLHPRAIGELADQLRRTLRPGGTVIVCSWLHPIVGWPLDGREADEVLLDRCPFLEVVGQYVENDFEVLVLSRPDRAGIATS